MDSGATDCESREGDLSDRLRCVFQDRNDLQKPDFVVSYARDVISFVFVFKQEKNYSQFTHNNI